MSFNEKLSYTEHVVTTPTTDFPFGFKFIEGVDAVRVLVNDVDALEAGYAIRLKNSVTMELQPAVESGVVRIYRETNIDDSMYRFTAGAKFVASNMDANFNQILHSQQEVRDQFIKLRADTFITLENFQEENFKELKEYVDGVLGMTNPNIFDGITDNMVITEDGLSQRSTNRDVAKRLEDLEAGGEGTSGLLQEEVARATAAENALNTAIIEERDRAIEAEDELRTLSESIAGGYLTAKATLAELQAVSGTEGQVGKVMDDGINSGDYWFTGGQWRKGYNPEMVIRELLNANGLFTPITLDGSADLDVLPTGYYFIPSDSVASTIKGIPPQMGSPRRGYIFCIRKGTTAYQVFTRDSSQYIDKFERTGNGQTDGGVAFAWLPWVTSLTRKDLDVAAQKAVGLGEVVASTKDYVFTLLTSAQANFEVKPYSPHSSTVTLGTQVNGIPTATATASAAYPEVVSTTYNSNLAGHFQSDWLAKAKATGLSLFLVMESVKDTTGGYVAIVERDDSGATVTNTRVADVVDSTTPTVITYDGLKLNARTTRIEVLIRFTGEAAKPASFTYSRINVSPSLAAGYYTAPKSKPLVLNQFPNYYLTSAGASMYQASASNGVMTMNVTSTFTQVMYDVAADGVFKAGSDLNWSCDVYSDRVRGMDITLIFLDVNGATIGTIVPAANLTINAWERVTQSGKVPANCTTVRFRFVRRAGDTKAKARNPVLSSSDSSSNVINLPPAGGTSTATTTVYIASTGSDTTGDGSKGNPYYSLAKAGDKIVGSGTIYVGDGDYEGGGLDIGKFDYIRIAALANTKPRFLVNPKVTGFVKSTGYTNVYEVEHVGFTASWIFVHDVPDVRTLIKPEERLPHQRGLTHRMLSTRLERMATVAEVDAAQEPAFTQADGKLYVNFFGTVVDPSTADVRVPRVSSALIRGGSGHQHVVLEGLNIMYNGGNGVNALSLSRIDIYNCTARFNAGQGFALYDSRVINVSMSIAGSNRGDGFNMHRQLPNPRMASVTYANHNAWAHDNWDDGDSMHENCVGTYSDSLFEYNGDRGVATSYGSHCTATNCIARGNGTIFNKLGATNGEGFAVVGEVNAGNDDGVGTQMVCINCVSEDNIQNYSISSGGGRFLIVNSISRNAKSTGYHRVVAGSIMELQNCHESGSAELKSSGIVINNSELVT